MTQTVTVPGVGDLEFPDGMSQQDMASAIQKNFPQIHQSTDAEKLAKGIPVKGDAGIPTPAAPPPAPSWSDDPVGAFKQRVLQPVNNATEAAIRGVGGAVTGTLGGIGGLLDMNPTAPGVKPMDAESHAQAANAEYQRLVDKVIGPQSQGSKDMLQAVGEHMPRELEALPGMQGEAGTLAAAARGARLPPVAMKVPGAAKVGEVIDKARGVPATAQAESLRTRSLEDAAGHAARAREAAQRATEQATRAGLDAEHAGAWGAAAQNNLDNAAKVGDAIEQQLLSRPTMSKEELGAMMRAAGTTLRDEKLKARRAAAGYDQATAQDGGKIVSTDAARAVIEAEKESLKNPNLRATLERVNKELQPGPNATPTILGPDGKPLAPTSPQGLTLTQAESLRDYLNDAIAEKSGTAMSAVDKSSERALLKIKDALTEQMEATSPLWKQANKNFRDASRGELDHLLGKGDLAKTLQTDSLSGQYMQTEAEVTGHIIAKANAGSPVLSMLAKQAPEIKNAARMYYTRELFGSGTLPTPKVMQNFVDHNERSLKQLGLYGEFKDIASAQRARLQAVDDFKQQLKQAGSAESNATRAETAATSQAAKHQRVADRFSQFQTEIANVPPKQLPGHIKALGKALQDEGLITQDQYGQMIRESDAAAAGFDSADKTRKTILKVAGIIGLGAVGTEAAKRGITP